MQLTPSTQRGLRLLYIVSVAVVVLVIAAFVVKVRDVDRFKRQAESNAADVAALRVQVQQLGGTPVVRGEPGQNATDEQVSAAVQGYLQAHPPAAGRAPTPSEVAAGVASYCAANTCQGPAGATGTASDAQVASAVSTFCAARTGCTGPPGAQGETGAAGATGQAGSPPSGFTIELQGNKVLTCTPDTPAGPGSSPHYTCR